MITPFRVVLVAVIIGCSMAVLMSMRAPNPPPETGLTEAAPPPPPAMLPTSQPVAQLASGPRTTTPSGLTMIEVKEGAGAPVKSGDSVTVNYIGRLYLGGAKFDSSYDRGDPLPFTVGAGQLIKGFDEGVLGMKPGGKRELIIPSELGYGPQAMGKSIPANSTLVFDVELMSIQPPK